ncbi:hypothetical protein LB452_11395 [Psychroflexus sp. CAK8W]|uniref:Uncharacterized protein n=1 Tax=Psychroflexus longus TaxID=2873596 RepID=A0ABS7XNU4_9FLAO|nr:hypothetical protein [Psychroflexus longus]MBZ9779526.1 hypothetical protein [Psychroflexus longus]
MLVRTFAFAANDPNENFEFELLCLDSLDIESNIDVDYGLCMFSYSITATNQVTGEVITRNYTQTANDSSETEYKAYAKTTMMLQARLVQAELNN